MSASTRELLSVTASALQLSLGLVFLLAVVPKLWAPDAFSRTVAEYRIGPPAMAPALARGVIALEVFLAFALLTGVLVAVAVPLALLVLAGFAIAVGLNLHRRRTISCGCFGAKSETISGRSLARLGLLLATVVALLALDAVVAPPPLLLGDAPGVGYLLQVAGMSLALLLVGMWLLHLPELWWVVGQLWRSSPRVEVEQRKEAA